MLYIFVGQAVLKSAAFSFPGTFGKLFKGSDSLTTQKKLE